MRLKEENEFFDGSNSLFTGAFKKVIEVLYLSYIVEGLFSIYRMEEKFSFWALKVRKLLIKAWMNSGRNRGKQ